MVVYGCAGSKSNHQTIVMRVCTAFIVSSGARIVFRWDIPMVALSEYRTQRALIGTYICRGLTHLTSSEATRHAVLRQSLNISWTRDKETHPYTHQFNSAVCILVRDHLFVSQEITADLSLNHIQPFGAQV